MSVYIQDDDLTIRLGDVRDELAAMPEGSVDCVVTSPPYWGLRKYPGPPSVWGDGWEGQLGLEPSVDMYVEHLVEVFAQVYRVLSPWGTVWLNLGDTYSSGDRTWYSEGRINGFARAHTFRPPSPEGLQEKALVQVPARVTIALQQAGWVLRSEIAWWKTNAQPESVTDRPTVATETIFLLVKQPVGYFYDPFGEREPASWERWGAQTTPKYDENSRAKGAMVAEASLEDMDLDGRRVLGKNMRNVWPMKTVPYPDAHFAVFPPELPRRCIRLGCPEQVCVTCGEPRRRLTGRACRECGSVVPTQAKECAMCGYRNAGWRDGRIAEESLLTDETGSTPGRAVPRRPGPLRREITPTLIDLGLSRCGCGAGLEPDALEVIASPAGSGGTDDPSLERGRAGLGRPRGEGDGRRPITRYEQREYARQLRDSSHRSEMSAEAGEAFAHYIRTDRAGARPVPEMLLGAWLARRWLEPVVVPEVPESSYRKGIVADIFLGSGTTAIVAREEARVAVGIDVSDEYAKQAAGRTQQLALHS